MLGANVRRRRKGDYLRVVFALAGHCLSLQCKSHLIQGDGIPMFMMKVSYDCDVACGQEVDNAPQVADLRENFLRICFLKTYRRHETKGKVKVHKIVTSRSESSEDGCRHH